MNDDVKHREISEEHKKRIEAIGKKVRYLRENIKPKVSYEEFAITNGIHRITYYNLEKGKNFNMSTLLKVLDAHNTSLSDFFNDLV